MAAKHAENEEAIENIANDEREQGKTVVEFSTENAKPSKDTIARTVAFGLVWLNQLFAFIGAPTLDLDPDAVYAGVSTGITFAVSFLAWWKNNSFTKAAIVGDQVKDVLQAEDE